MKNKNIPLVLAMVERVHPYFTASPFFPNDIKKAWIDGKERYINTLKRHIEAVEQMTLEDYCKKTGSDLLK